MKKLLLFLIVLVLVGFFFSRTPTGNSDYTTEDLYSNDLFSENLDPSFVYSFQNKAKFQLLEKDLRGLNNLRTQDYLIMFKYGSNEVHFIPIEDGKTVSSKRIKYKIAYGGPIDTALTYGLESMDGVKSILSIESELQNKGSYVVKHVFDDKSRSYAKRGILEAI